MFSVGEAVFACDQSLDFALTAVSIHGRRALLVGLRAVRCVVGIDVDLQLQPNPKPAADRGVAREWASLRSLTRHAAGESALPPYSVRFPYGGNTKRLITIAQADHAPGCGIKTFEATTQVGFDVLAKKPDRNLTQSIVACGPAVWFQESGFDGVALHLGHRSRHRNTIVDVGQDFEIGPLYWIAAQRILIMRETDEAVGHWRAPVEDMHVREVVGIQGCLR